MNILHHKSWHVRNKDNIERVRRDEENARKEEEEKLRKVALAESEARTDLLRKKATKQLKNDEKDSTQDNIVACTSQHINFFKDIEDGKKEAKGNAEYEKEKKEEKEKQEKAIGLLTYLGQSSLESQVEQPWYLKKRKHEEVEEDSQRPRDESNKKAKYRDDPMRLMTKYVDTKRKVEGKELNPKYRLSKAKESLPQSSKTDKHETHKKKHQKKHKKKEKKQKKQKKKKRSKDSDSSSSEESQVIKKPGKTIQQLRAERMKREQEERQKSKVLLKKLHNNGDDEDKDNNKTNPEIIYDDRKRSYNSQFNPDFVRKPKNRRKDFSDFR